MSSFKVGDVCITHTVNRPANHGKVVTLIRALTPKEMSAYLLNEMGLNLGVPNETIWEIDEKLDWHCLKNPIVIHIPFASESMLRKLDDGNKITSWDECIWRPKDLNVHT